LPEPTAAELAKEAEQEAAVFAQAVNVDKLLTMLRGLDPAKDNLADNEEIQELYRSSMALRPKIVKLIDKYSQKRADLVSMNESFVKARTIFDRMMEDSLAMHSGCKLFSVSCLPALPDS
jgi:signal transducing adaptor molecule